MQDRSARALLQKSAGDISIIGFGVALVYSAFAFGAATPATRDTLDVILLVSSLSGVLSLADIRQRARAIALPLILSLLILGQALVAYSNPSHHFDSELGSLVKAGSPINWLPSSADPDSTLPELRHIGAMLIALLVLTALFNDNSRRWQLLSVMALCGAGVAIAGITQKLIDAPSLLWVDKAYHEHQKTFFAAFRYHGHAAAFLNLCWPAALALLVRAMAKPRNQLRRVLWAVTLLLIFAALLFNTSKYGHLSVAPALLAAGCLFRHYYSRSTSRVAFTRKTAAILLLATTATLISLWPVAARSINNWGWEIENHGSLGGRFAVYSVCIDMIQSAGVFGSGAGTFHRLIPYYAVANSAHISGVWIHAHQDYLQTIIEWGWVGTTAWLGLIAIAFSRHLRIWRPDRDKKRSLLTLSIAVSLLALLFLAVHALIDFPVRIGAVQIYAVVYLAVLWSGRGHRRYKKQKISIDPVPAA